MGKLYFGLVLTLLVSLLVMLAGGLVARRTVTEVEEVNQMVFGEFVAGFGQLIKELEEKREDALIKLVGKVNGPGTDDLLEKLEEVPGVRGAFLFKDERKSKEWLVLGEVGSRSPAELIEEGKKVPLIPERAIVVGKQFFDEVAFGTKGRIDNEEGSFHGWWYSPLQGELVVLLIENKVAELAFLEGLKKEAAAIFEVAERQGEKLAVEYDGEVILVSDSIPRDREASREIRLGGYSVKGWNAVAMRSLFHWPTMWSAAGFGFVIAVVGVGLFVSQKKMWLESEERVSFVNRVSHELGTPLTNMALNLELAARSMRTRPEAAGERLEKVREEVARLGRLVTNVLNHSRNGGEEIKEQRMRCDPDEVVKGVVDQFRPALERREMTVDWQPGKVGEMILNADALSQIVWNLISNVEKYASSGRWLGVRTELKAEVFKVAVLDRGKGVAKGKRAGIFKAFERVHDSTREGVSGTGLGLSISRDLAASMGGELVLMDDPEMTIFELTIPMKKR